MNILKKGLLVLAGAATLAVAGTASAMSPPYAICTFKGDTTLVNTSIGTAACWLTVTAKVDCAGNLEIVAAGPVPGDSTCANIFLGGFPWTGTTPALGTIHTPTSGSAIVPISPSTYLPVGLGDITGVSGANYSNVTCDGSGNVVSVPGNVYIAGTNNYGGLSSLNTTDPVNGLRNLGCNLVP